MALRLRDSPDPKRKAAKAVAGTVSDRSSVRVGQAAPASSEKGGPTGRPFHSPQGTPIRSGTESQQLVESDGHPRDARLGGLRLKFAFPPFVRLLRLDSVPNYSKGGFAAVARSWPDLREAPSYSIAEAARYLGISASTLRAWMLGQEGFRAVIDIADPKTRTMSFVNLVEAYVLAGIRRKHGVSLPKTRAAIEYVREQLAVERPLADEQFETNGVDLFVQRLGSLLNVSQNGQQAMAEVMRQYLRRIDRDPSGVPIKLYPLTRSCGQEGQPKLVVIDPRLSFGRPVLSGSGVPTAVLAERFKAGESIESLATDYELKPDAVLEAIRCELSARQAA